MKQYYFISMVVAVVIVAVLAAMKPALKLDSTTFSVDIRCQNCVNRLKAGLPEVCPGIFGIEADVPTHKVTVTYERGTETVESLLIIYSVIWIDTYFFVCLYHSMQFYRF